MFNWEDAWAYRFGVQYSVLHWLDLRAGFVYDEKAVPDETLSPLLPSGDRQLYTFGASGHYKSLTLDFAYNYLVDENRTWNNEKGDPSLLQAATGVISRVTGEFKDGSAHIFGMLFMVKEDKSFDPGGVALLGANGIMLEPDAVTNLVQQFFRRFNHLK